MGMKNYRPNDKSYKPSRTMVGLCKNRGCKNPRRPGSAFCGKCQK